jgi:hypothetical protein
MATIVKTTLTIVLIITLFATSFGQQKKNPATMDFDFWIGEWNTEASVPPKWETNFGEDVVRYLLDNTLIEEVFTKRDENGTNFQRGYLVYLHREKRWRHTIHDAKWGEYSFYGTKDGDEIVLYSDPKSTRPGLRRETFKNISEQSFDYVWEASNDGGKNWNPFWKVHYTRKMDTTVQFEILNKFIAANNAGTKEAIVQFIKETYAPSLYTKIDLQEHLKFYTMISEDFGLLKLVAYEIIEEGPHKLIVHLIKERESLQNKSINPSEILVVEIELDEKHPEFLKKGLGLGALICEAKK